MIVAPTDRLAFVVLSVAGFLSVGSRCVDLEFRVPHGGVMSLSYDRADFVSDYDECTVLLLSAFFSVTGQTSKDTHLRKAIEDLLVDLIKAQNTTAPSNIIPFRRQWQPFLHRD